MLNVEQVKQSFDRCSPKGEMIDKFYNLFFDLHPEIKPKFANTNFENQKKALLQGLDLAIMFASDEPVGKIGISRIKKSHSKSNLNILPELYPYWKVCFIQTVSEMDPKFSDELKEQWDLLLQKSIDHIIGGYED